MKRKINKKKSNRNQFRDSISEDDDDTEELNNLRSRKAPSQPSSKTPVIDSFSRDLTKLAEENKLDPIVGREREILRVSQILSRRKKNNVLILGEPGCVDYHTVIEVRKISDYGEHKIVVVKN